MPETSGANKVDIPPRGVGSHRVQDRLRALVYILNRISRLSVREYRIATSISFTLSLAKMMLKCLPFRRIQPLLGQPLKSADTNVRHDIDPNADVNPKCLWFHLWIDRVVRWIPWRATCLEQALAVAMLLRFKGISYQVHFGVSQTGEKKFGAHAWVTSNGQILCGDREAEDFTVVAVYGWSR